MIETVTLIPPQIIQTFDPLLLMNTLERINWTVNKKILPRAFKKHAKCLGQKKIFEKLFEEYKVLYGIKTDEEAEYQAKIKEKAKRPHFPATGQTIRFKRISTSQ